MSPEHLAAAPDDEGNVFDDDDQDTSEVGEQAEDAPRRRASSGDTSRPSSGRASTADTSGRRARPTLKLQMGKEPHGQDSPGHYIPYPFCFLN